jgi:Skp family chaperone for outer membrane proteins
MNIALKSLVLAGTILIAPILTHAASAASIIGLVDGKTLVSVDPTTKKVTGKATSRVQPTSSESTCVRPTACCMP